MFELSELSEGTIRSAYDAIYTSAIPMATIGIVSVLAIGFFIYRIVKVYVAETSKSKFDFKVFWELIKEYARYSLIIAVLPIVIPFVELAFAEVQDKLQSSYNTSLETTFDKAAEDWLNAYEKETEKEVEVGDSLSLSSMLGLKNVISNIYAGLVMGIWICLFAILKYIYFMYVAGRYLYLIMLQTIAPIAVICLASENYKKYFDSWLTKMFSCYLLVPFLMIADVFSEQIIASVSNASWMSQYGLLGVIFAVCIKVSFFSIVTKKTYNLF